MKVEYAIIETRKQKIEPLEEEINKCSLKGWRYAGTCEQGIIMKRKIKVEE